MEFDQTISRDNFVVSFILYRELQEEVLLERRLHKPTSPFFGKEIYPAGKIKPNETPIQTLFREFGEEFSQLATIKQYSQLATRGVVVGESGKLIIPFAITEWSGEIPDRNPDNGNIFLWRKINDILKNTDLNSTRILTQALLGFIASQS